MLEHGDLHTVEHVLERFNAIGDRLGQANVRQPLGKLYLGQSEPDSIQAVARILDQALALYQEIGDRVGQTNISTPSTASGSLVGGKLKRRSVLAKRRWNWKRPSS